MMSLSEPITPVTTFSWAMVQGARLGLKWTTYIIGPIAVLCLLLGLGLIGYRVVFVDGAAFLTWKNIKVGVLGPFGMYLVCCLWGAFLGTIIRCAAYLARGG
jgi:hypothetical protein